MVHTYTLNGYNIAIDENSGSIHLLDDISFHILKEMQEFKSLDYIISCLDGMYDTEDIVEAYKEIEELKENELLFTSNESLEELACNMNYSHSLKALCLHVAHDCNLRCEYCFASKGDYKSGRSLMSEEVALKAVDYLVNNSGDRYNIEIDFFGGEPLLNFDLVKKVVEYGRSIEKIKNKKFYFTITTNGVLLNDEKINYINEYMDNVVISIDGRKEIHDSIRYDINKNGTYDRIVPLAQKLVNGRGNKRYFVRGTFTKRNKDFSKDVRRLADLGFKEISVEPVVGTGQDMFFDEDDIPEILSEYEKLAVEYLKWLDEGLDFRFYHFNIDLYDGPCLFKRIMACGAGVEYFAVSPIGELYPCHQFVGEKDFIAGDIYNGINSVEMGEKFKNTNILTKQKCKNCWAKLFCSGGCHANAFYSNGDITMPNELACILQKKRIECAIMIQIAKEMVNKN